MAFKKKFILIWHIYVDPLFSNKQICCNWIVWGIGNSYRLFLGFQFNVFDYCTEILAIANYEFFSSMLKDFQVSGTNRYPTQQWTPIGNFTSQNSRRLQYPIFLELYLYIVDWRSTYTLCCQSRRGSSTYEYNSTPIMVTNTIALSRNWGSMVPLW